MKSPLILCIDFEEWYHGRWATGSPIARWKNVKSFFRDYYHTDKPIGEVIEPTKKILKILKQNDVKATFFILGEMAEWYPDLVRKIASCGHEVACHGLHHRDLTMMQANQFALELAQSRKILEKLSGKKIIGFRAPNLVITPWLHEVLIKQKFLYDSSVCPSRSLQGKYINQTQAPCNPYRVSRESILKKGDTPLYEIPIPAFPILKLPGAVSIATRIFGLKWTEITLNTALKTGAAVYYLHPCEFNPPPKLIDPTFKERIFFRRSGSFMTKALEAILKKYSGRIIPIKDYLTKIV